jgi:hypothetical protein
MTAATGQVPVAAVILDRRPPAQPRPVQVDVDHVQDQPAAVWWGPDIGAKNGKTARGK